MFRGFGSIYHFLSLTVTMTAVLVLFCLTLSAMLLHRNAIGCRMYDCGSPLSELHSLSVLKAGQLPHQLSSA